MAFPSLLGAEEGAGPGEEVALAPWAPGDGWSEGGCSTLLQLDAPSAVTGVWGGHMGQLRGFWCWLWTGVLCTPLGLCEGTLLGHFFSHKPSFTFPHLPQPLGCSLQLRLTIQKY